MPITTYINLSKPLNKKSSNLLIRLLKEEAEKLTINGTVKLDRKAKTSDSNNKSYKLYNLKNGKQITLSHSISLTQIDTDNIVFYVHAKGRIAESNAIIKGIYASGYLKGKKFKVTKEYDDKNNSFVSVIKIIKAKEDKSIEEKQELVERTKREVEITKIFHTKVSNLTTHEKQANSIKIQFRMPFIEGMSIHSFIEQIKQNQMLSSNRFLYVLPALIAVIKAIKRIEAENLVHLDLKPQNIIFNPNQLIAQVIDYDSTISEGEIPTLTVYTPRYTPPERMDSKYKDIANRKFHIYALGVIICDLLGLSKKDQNNPHISGCDKTTISEIKKFLQKCLAPAPKYRPDLTAVYNFFIEIAKTYQRNIYSNKLKTQAEQHFLQAMNEQPHRLKAHHLESNLAKTKLINLRLGLKVSEKIFQSEINRIELKQKESDSMNSISARLMGRKNSLTTTKNSISTQISEIDSVLSSNITSDKMIEIQIQKMQSVYTSTSNFLKNPNMLRVLGKHRNRIMEIINGWITRPLSLSLGKITGSFQLKQFGFFPTISAKKILACQYEIEAVNNNVDYIPRFTAEI